MKRQKKVTQASSLNNRKQDACGTLLKAGTETGVSGTDPRFRVLRAIADVMDIDVRELTGPEIMQTDNLKLRNDIGMDQDCICELSLQLEKEFNCSICDCEVKSWETIEDVVELFETQVQLEAEVAAIIGRCNKVSDK